MSESVYRKILKRRLGRLLGGPDENEAKPKRVQKNLTISELDARRLVELARRDGQSQSQLLSVALDCYEDCFGAVRAVDRR